MKIQRFTARLAISTILGAFGIFNTFGQTSAFSYQGKLTDAGVPANGAYIMQFGLWNAATSGTSIGILSDLNVNVRDGVFNVQLDFGAAAISGNDLYLEVSVKKLPGDTYTTLTPRQQILSAPHAIKSGTAGSSEDSAKLGGVDAARFVQSDASGNVSLIGNLTVAGSTTYDTVNAATQFDLGGLRALASDSSGNLSVGTTSGTAPTVARTENAAGASPLAGSNNTFVGNWVGTNNTTGGYNAFAGYGAGNHNTTGSNNAFFGAQTGFKNTGGEFNSFFGSSSGRENTTGSYNSFSGYQAGFQNTSGGFNSLFGAGTGYANTTGGYLSFFGASAGAANTTGLENSFFGYHSGQNNINGTQNSFFGSLAGLATTSGNYNTFVGRAAGANNTTGSSNVAVGAASAGACCGSAMTGSANSLFGLAAGGYISSGSYNSFYGYQAGGLNTSGNTNSFFGASAGYQNSIGGGNSFFGYSSGSANTTGNNNAFYGAGAGENNAAGAQNSFVGASAGGNNTGNLNSFFGNGAGFTNTTGTNNTAIGASADVGSGVLTNATAIGANAVVSQSNSLVLGNNANVGIGTSAPTAKLEVLGDAKVTGTGNGVVFPDGTKQTTAAAGAAPRMIFTDTGTATTSFPCNNVTSTVPIHTVNFTKNAASTRLRIGYSDFVYIRLPSGESGSFPWAEVLIDNIAISPTTIRMQFADFDNTSTGTVFDYAKAFTTFGFASGVSAGAHTLTVRYFFPSLGTGTGRNCSRGYPFYPSRIDPYEIEIEEVP
ncbi:MAG: hypothetical protein IT173_13810 [Acidobacteria bacterium]|nr:hypothetical protein [Acidobacteriota bacterium]